MKITTIRFNQSQQVNDVAKDRCAFNFYTVYSTGWERGARTRHRNFETPANVFAYLDKLHEGGWLSDVEHLSATNRFCALIDYIDQLKEGAKLEDDNSLVFGKGRRTRFSPPL